MSGTGTGDDAPGDSGPRAAGGRAVIRSEGGAGESGAMAAADTAVALPTPTPGGTDPGTAAEAATDTGAAADAPKRKVEENLIGTTLLGRYTIHRKIGQGGMGVVYEATHTLIGKRVAVKVLLDKYARKEQIVARLEQEARLASAIGHEHIIDITDFGQTDDGRTFVVMEFLEGESLAEILAREGPLPEERILAVAIQVAGALGAAHAKGIVHRDVKPENVFVLRRKDRDFVKVVDFGISKSLRASDGHDEESPRLTQTGMVLGTPLYMSPEQARGDEELDARIDVYALGVIMYEIATGRVPFTGANYLSIISQVLNEEPKPPRALRPDLSDEVEAIILKAIEKDRDRRYQSTEEMLADLTALHDDPTHSTQRARISGPRRSRLARGSNLRLAAWIAVVSAIVAGVAITVTLLAGGGPARRKVAAAAVVPIDAGPPPPPPIDAAPAPPPMAKITIETVPPGAMLYEGNRELGPAPYDGEWPLEEETIHLVAAIDGYDDAECNIRPAIDNGKVVRCRLNKVKSGHVQVIRRPHRPDGAAGGGSGSGSGSGGGGGPGSAPHDPSGPGNAGGGDLSGNPFPQHSKP
ncbi:MAG TPA: serine/threonine-protein kinase [Kofleriaceae bacterium]|nr:serine/threonine-protein kinase [Kofleriaceae bacterium]